MTRISKTIILLLLLIQLCSGQYTDVGVFKDANILDKYQSEVNARVTEILPGGHFFTFEYRLGLFDHTDINFQVHKFQFASYINLQNFSYLAGTQIAFARPFNFSIRLSYTLNNVETHVSESPAANFRFIEMVSTNIIIGNIDYFTTGLAIVYRESNSKFSGMNYLDYFPYWYIGMGHYTANNFCPEFGFVFRNEIEAYIGVGYNFSFIK